MVRVEKPIAQKEVEGDLGQRRKQCHAQNIAVEIAGMLKALGQQKGEDGKGQPPCGGTPDRELGDSIIEMVEQHQRHGDDVQGKG